MKVVSIFFTKKGSTSLEVKPFNIFQKLETSTL